MCSRKRGSNFFALKTLHIYYTTQIALRSSERLNDALHLLYPVDCDLFRPCIYYTTGLPTINPIYLLYHGFWNVFVVYLLYHRVTIWWHVHCTAGWQTFSWCIHLTTGVTRVSPLQNPCIYYTPGWQLRSSERLNNALHLLYQSSPESPRPAAIQCCYPRFLVASMISFSSSTIFSSRGRISLLNGVS